MSFLRNLFGSKQSTEIEPLTEGYRILYGHEAYELAQRANLWQIGESGVTVCSIQKLPSPAPSDEVDTHDVVLSLRLRCQRHGKHLSLNSEPVFGTPASSRSFELPCGCCSKFDIASTGSREIFAWSYDELIVEDVREEPMIPRGLTFDACPNCSKTVEAGSGRHFDVLQCLGCGTRYCYNCWHKEYISVTCPSCRLSPSIEVGAVYDGAGDCSRGVAGPASTDEAATGRGARSH